MKALNYFILLFVLVLTAGCCNKELCPDCDPQEGIEIKFDWKNAKTIPAGMTVLFYSMENELVYTFNNVPPQGEMIAIKAGKYRVACYNNDTEYVQWTGADNLDSLHVSSRKTMINGIASGSKTDEDLVAIPDLLYGDVLVEDEILPFQSKVQIVLLTPEPLLDYYSYQISDIVNAQYIDKVEVTLSGLSNSYFLAEPDYQLKVATIPFHNNEINIVQQEGTGNMINMGYFRKNPKNILTLYLWTKGGNFRATYDVTEQVLKAPDPHFVHIIIKTNLVIPPPIEGDDGLDPSVDEWKDINYDIIL